MFDATSIVPHFQHLVKHAADHLKKNPPPVSTAPINGLSLEAWVASDATFSLNIDDTTDDTTGDDDNTTYFVEDNDNKPLGEALLAEMKLTPKQYKEAATKWHTRFFPDDEGGYSDYYASLTESMTIAHTQAVTTITMSGMKAQMQSQIADMKSGGDMDPVEGLSLEDWAKAYSRMAGGTPMQDVFKSLKMEQPQWDRISAEWMARMSRDTTGAIATVYGQAFMQGSSGEYAAAGQAAANLMNPGTQSGGADPVPFEKWVEISAAQQAASEQGIDPQADLKEKFNLSLMDWVNINNYWAQEYAMNWSKYSGHDELFNKYKNQYAAPTAADDIDF
jgi:hypothetical protein